MDTIKNKVKILNNPTSIRNVSEKLYSVRYQRYMPSTIFTQNIIEIRKFFRIHKKVILKPIHSYSGNDIHLLNRFNSRLINKFIKKHDHIMCQKFLPKISKGDKRVFLINGKVCGAISRVPKKGSFLSNMSKGAKPINIKLTKTENKISLESVEVEYDHPIWVLYSSGTSGIPKAITHRTGGMIMEQYK